VLPVPKQTLTVGNDPIAAELTARGGVSYELRLARDIRSRSATGTLCRVRIYAGKTADERRDERRSRLVAAGRRLFGEFGYHGTSMRAVLREARLPDRYFAESFKSMEDLLAAVLHEISIEMFVRIGECLDPRAPAAEQIRHLFGNLVRALEKDPGAARIKLLEVSGVSPYIDCLRLAALKPYVEATCARLPEPPPDSKLDRMIFAQAYVSGTNGMLVDWANGTLPLTGEQLTEQATLLFEALEGRLIGNPTPLS
jgi:AcrR family transcriptional regulator